MSIILNIDGKPVAKGRGRIGKVNGHATIFTPAKTRQNENLIKLAAMEAMAGRDPIEGAVEVFIDIYVNIPKSASKKKQQEMRLGFIRPTPKPDLDNYVKSAFDGINTIIIKDDSQIVTHHAHKFYGDKPRMRIEIREIAKSEVEAII